MGNLGKLGTSAAIGIIFGIAAMMWIKPDNAGGAALIVVVCTALIVIAGAIVAAIRGR